MLPLFPISAYLNENMAILLFFSTPTPPFNVENDLPISPSMISFDLDIETKCDLDLLSLILRCMPNLRGFVLTMITSSFISPFWADVLNGQHWQQLLTSYVPQLNTFDLFLQVFIDSNLNIDIDAIIHSFDYFTTKYNDWCLNIYQSRHRFHNHGKIIIAIFFLKITNYLCLWFSKTI